MKWSREILQTLLYFRNTKIPMKFNFFFFRGKLKVSQNKDDFFFIPKNANHEVSH